MAAKAWVLVVLLSSSAALAAASACGNGVIEVGEQCDDGDDNPANQCNNACQLKHADVLILGPTMVANHEKMAAEAAGLTVDVVTETHMRALKTEDFRRYKALVFGDPRAPFPQVIADTVAEWGPAMNGNVMLVGGDPSDHGRVDATRAFIQYAAGGRTGTTGFYAAVDYHDSDPQLFLPWLNTAFGAPGEEFGALGGADFDTVYQTLTGPGLEAFSEGLLNGWDFSVHVRWTTFPETFSVLAMAADGPPTVSMVRVGHAADGPQPGAPYILVRTTTGQLATGMCGDGSVEAGEECDDGNTVGGDGCAADCLFEVCGNGQIDIGEDCDDGNELDHDGCTNCVVDPCGTSDNCSLYAECQNTGGSSFTCTCRSGFTGSGSSCTDIDECAQGTHTCGPNQQCSNLLGSFDCQCGPGTTDDGSGGCTDVDECSNADLANCHADATCTNTDGGFTCTCPSGTTGDGVSACEPLPTCGEPNSEGAGLDCTCPAAANTYSVAVAIDFVPDTDSFHVLLTGAFAPGVVIQGITLGPGDCFQAAHSDFTCVSDCMCRAEFARSRYLESCQWLKEPLSLGETGVKVAARVAHTKATRNILGDVVVTPDVATNVVEIVTERLIFGIGQTPDVQLVDALVTQDRLLPAAVGSGNDLAMQELDFKIVSQKVELLPGATFSNPDVVVTVIEGLNTCDGALCALHLTVRLATHADLCSFSGELQIPLHPTCAGCSDFPIVADLEKAEYDFRFCRSQAVELASVANVNIVQLNQLATATEPAVFQVTAEVLDVAGNQVPSTLLGVVAYHAQDGEACSAAAASTQIVDGNGDATVPWVTVTPTGDPSQPLHTLKISILATEEAVRAILALEGGDAALERLRESYTISNMCIGFLRMRELEAPTRRRLARVARATTATSAAATAPRAVMASRSSSIGFQVTSDAVPPPSGSGSSGGSGGGGSGDGGWLVIAAVCLAAAVALTATVAAILVFRPNKTTQRRASGSSSGSSASMATTVQVASNARGNATVCLAKPVSVDDTMINVM